MKLVIQLTIYQRDYHLLQPLLMITSKSCLTSKVNQLLTRRTDSSIFLLLLYKSLFYFLNTNGNNLQHVHMLVFFNGLLNDFVMLYFIYILISFIEHWVAPHLKLVTVILLLNETKPKFNWVPPALPSFILHQHPPITMQQILNFLSFMGVKAVVKESYSFIIQLLLQLLKEANVFLFV